MIFFLNVASKCGACSPVSVWSVKWSLSWFSSVAGVGWSSSVRSIQDITGLLWRSACFFSLSNGLIFGSVPKYFSALDFLPCIILLLSGICFSYNLDLWGASEILNPEISDLSKFQTFPYMLIWFKTIEIHETNSLRITQWNIIIKLSSFQF